MTKLRRKDTAQTDRRRAELQQRLFGDPKPWDSTTPISYRDAQDRADKLSRPEEAAALLERAIMSGDEILGRAIAMRAMGRITFKGMGGDGWAQVVDRWVENQPPETALYVQELADIEHDSSDIKVRFAAGLNYSLPTPSRLAGKNVDRLAAQVEGLPE